MEIALLTDVGQKRTNNQEYVKVLEETKKYFKYVKVNKELIFVDIK